MGGDDANLVSVLPALSAPEPVPSTEGGSPARGATPAAPGSPAVRPGSLDRSADDTDVGWGDREAGSNDDRLTADKPPHW